MIRISVEVCSGAARFRAGIRATSVERAVRLANALYPGSPVKVLFPDGPDKRFAGPAVFERAAWPEAPEKAAG